MANKFWYMRVVHVDIKNPNNQFTTGQYVVGMDDVAIATITAPNGDEALAAQWAQCCANALNARERELVKGQPVATGRSRNRD